MANAMQYPMRRGERAVTDMPGIPDILQKCQVMRLGLSSPEGPYVVPLNFGYALQDGGRLILYFHCAQEGRKAQMLSQDPRVCFEVDCSHGLIEGPTPCKYSFGYESVIGFGIARPLKDPKEKDTAFCHIMARFSAAPTFEFDPAVLEKTAVWAIRVEQVAGKRR